MKKGPLYREVEIQEVLGDFYKQAEAQGPDWWGGEAVRANYRVVKKQPICGCGGRCLTEMHPGSRELDQDAAELESEGEGEGREIVDLEGAEGTSGVRQNGGASWIRQETIDSIRKFLEKK